ncbi:MAG: hypothetical protein EHM47_10275 [Ignavibacteriales bacterium]|nr:MAG: hypothetical protein EHM47_10275 [Ignavibacteriales bacterium]
MFDNPVIEVSIGLAFIYCIYSLFATIINEIIASILRLRAKNLQKALRRMLTDNDEDSPPENLFINFYEHPLIKYLSSGVLNYKPSYISPESFSKSVVDILKGLDSPNDKTAITRIQEQLEKLGKNKTTDTWDSDTMRLINSFLIDADYKLDSFKENLEKWFNDTMDRASGWYKRQIQFIILLIGFIMALAFNVNTIEIVNLLSKDKTARLQIVNIAENYVKDRNEFLDTSKTINRLDSLVMYAQNIYKTDVEPVNQILGSGFQWSTFSRDIFGNIIGCFITALAISLGAPFWFDLLNKIIKIRGTGTKPSEDKTKKT